MGKVVRKKSRRSVGAAQPVKEDLTIPDAKPLILYRDNEPFTIPCHVGSKSKDVQYSWQKDGKPLDLSKTAEAVQEQDGLSFKKSTPNDEGNYQCFAKTNYGVASSRVFSVKRTYIEAPKVNTAKFTPVEGKPFKLDCPIPKGYPEPVIAWEYQELSKRKTQGPDGSLYFSNVTKEDAQNTKYSCHAISPARDERIPLYEYTLETVKENNEKDGELLPQYLSGDIVTKAGSVTMFYCIFGGTPLAYPDWFHEGKNVSGNGGDRVTRHNRTGGKRLLIKDTQFSDQGTYTCEGHNGVGKVQRHSMKLTVVGDPVYLEQPDATITAPAGQDMRIICKVRGLPAPKITWTYNAQPLQMTEKYSVDTDGSGDNVSFAGLVIKNVQKSDIGYYGCIAENQYGRNYTETLFLVS